MCQHTSPLTTISVIMRSLVGAMSRLTERPVSRVLQTYAHSNCLGGEREEDRLPTARSSGREPSVIRVEAELGCGPAFESPRHAERAWTLGSPCYGTITIACGFCTY